MYDSYVPFKITEKLLNTLSGGLDIWASRYMYFDVAKTMFIRVVRFYRKRIMIEAYKPCWWLVCRVDI